MQRRISALSKLQKTSIPFMCQHYFSLYVNILFVYAAGDVFEILNNCSVWHQSKLKVFEAKTFFCFLVLVWKMEGLLASFAKEFSILQAAYQRLSWMPQCIFAITHTKKCLSWASVSSWEWRFSGRMKKRHRSPCYNWEPSDPPCE